MKTIEVDEELYRYIASHTVHIGESASDILRRMLNFCPTQVEVRTDESPEPANSESLSSDHINQIQELLVSGRYVEQKRAVNRFLLLLSVLYHIAPRTFAVATETLQGRKRLYFATDKHTLLRHGVHTKPQSVPETPYWVITNTNSERKRSMVGHIMETLHFSPQWIEKVCSTI